MSRLLGPTADTYTIEYIPAKHNRDSIHLANALSHGIKMGRIPDVKEAIAIAAQMKTTNIENCFPGWYASPN